MTFQVRQRSADLRVAVVVTALFSAWLTVRLSPGQNTVGKLEESPPNPLIKQFEGVEFVELRKRGNRYLIRRVPKAELKLPGREVAVTYVAKQFIRLHDVRRRADGRVDVDHARFDRWIPYASIDNVVDQFPPVDNESKTKSARATE